MRRIGFCRPGLGKGEVAIHRAARPSAAPNDDQRIYSMDVVDNLGESLTGNSQWIFFLVFWSKTFPDARSYPKQARPASPYQGVFVLCFIHLPVSPTL